MVQIITDIAAFREQAIESFGGEGISFQFEPDGEIFTVPHPLLLDDAGNEAIKAALGTIEVARALLNTEDDPEVHVRFVAAGGRSGDVLLAWRRLSEGLGAPK